MNRLRGLVALSIASMFVVGAVRLAGEPWGEVAGEDRSPLERFLDEALRRIPPEAPVCLDADLFGQSYFARFYPRPVYLYTEDMMRRHPGAWRVRFDGTTFDPGSASIEEPRDHP